MSSEFMSASTEIVPAKAEVGEKGVEVKIVTADRIRLVTLQKRQQGVPAMGRDYYVLSDFLRSSLSEGLGEVVGSLCSSIWTMGNSPLVRCNASTFVEVAGTQSLTSFAQMTLVMDAKFSEVVFKAVEEGRDEFFDTLTSKDVDKLLSLKDDDERSVLHVAAAGGRLQVCPSLISIKTGLCEMAV